MRVIEIAMYSKQCQVNFQITKEDYKNTLVLNDSYHEKTFDKAWHEYQITLTNMKDKKIKYHSDQVDGEAWNNGVSISNIAKIKKIIVTSNDVIFVTFCDITPLIDFSGYEITATYQSHTYHPVILNVVYQVRKTALMVNEDFSLDETSNIFIHYFNRFFHYQNIVTHEDLIAKAESLGYRADISTLTTTIMDNDDVLLLTFSMACKESKVTIANHNSFTYQVDKQQRQKNPHIRIGDDFQWHDTLFNDIAFHLPYPTVITAKNVRLRFDITYQLFQTYVKKLKLGHTNILFNTFYEYIKNWQLQDLSLSQKWLSDYLKVWLYECSDFQLFSLDATRDLNNDLTNIFILLKAKVTRCLLDDSIKVSSINALNKISKPLLVPVGYKINDQILTITMSLPKANLILALDEINEYHSDTIDSIFGVLLHLINDKNIFTYSQLGFNEKCYQEYLIKYDFLPLYSKVIITDVYHESDSIYFNLGFIK